MDSDLRASLIASVAAAALSALVGAVAGVPFLAILLRAGAGGLAFGALVYGAIALLRRFTPGLIDEGASGEAVGPAEAEEGPEPGSSVNIVLPAEGPGFDGRGEDAFGTEHGAEAGPEAAGGLEELPAAPRGAAGAAEDPGGYEFAAGSLVDAEDAEPVGARAAAGASPGPAESFDELDVLPDLESLSDSFEAAATRSMTRGADDDEGARRPRPTSSGGDRNSDPAVLAQAVRTLLKRDEKG